MVRFRFARSNFLNWPSRLSGAGPAVFSARAVEIVCSGSLHEVLAGLGVSTSLLLPWRPVAFSCDCFGRSLVLSNFLMSSRKPACRGAFFSAVEAPWVSFAAVLAPCSSVLSMATSWSGGGGRGGGGGAFPEWRRGGTGGGVGSVSGGGGGGGLRLGRLGGWVITGACVYSGSLYSPPVSWIWLDPALELGRDWFSSMLVRLLSAADRLATSIGLLTAVRSPSPRWLTCTKFAGPAMSAAVRWRRCVAVPLAVALARCVLCVPANGLPSNWLPRAALPRPLRPGLSVTSRTLLRARRADRQESDGSEDDRPCRDTRLCDPGVRPVGNDERAACRGRLRDEVAASLPLCRRRCLAVRLAAAPSIQPNAGEDQRTRVARRESHWFACSSLRLLYRCSFHLQHFGVVFGCRVFGLGLFPRALWDVGLGPVVLTTGHSGGDQLATYIL